MTAPSRVERVRDILMRTLGQSNQWMCEELAEAAIAASDAALAEAGYAIRPREPTEEMSQAGCWADPGKKDDKYTVMDGEGYAPAMNSQNIWRAMWDAAPKPEGE